MKKVIILGVAIGLILSACKHDAPELTDILIIDGAPAGSMCSPDSVYFKEQILPLFQSNCAQPGCHDIVEQQEGFIFNSYENIMASGEITPGMLDDGDVFEVITETNPDDIMPPPPLTPLSAAQINLIADWILQGAVNNSCPELFCDTLDVTFAINVAPLIQNSCSGCHSGQTPDAGLSLTSYTQIANIANNGLLLSAVTGTNNISLMPYNGTAISDCAIRTLEIWIENGAQDD